MSKEFFFVVKMQRDPNTNEGKAEISAAQMTDGYLGFKNGFHAWGTEEAAKKACPGKRVSRVNYPFDNTPTF